jgi:hypothetical protein
MTGFSAPTGSLKPLVRHYGRVLEPDRVSVALRDLCGCDDNVLGEFGEVVFADAESGPGGGDGDDDAAVEGTDRGADGSQCTAQR